MKNLILQVAVPMPPLNKKVNSTLSYMKDMYDHSQVVMKEYADRVGADYVCITEMDLKYTHPTFLRFKIFEQFKEYDQIMYVDADMFFHDMTPDLFEFTSRQRETAFMKIDSALPETSIIYNKNLRTSKTEKYYNAGFFLFKREFIDKFWKNHWDTMDRYKNTQWRDQDALNYMIRNEHEDIFLLSRDWNGVMAVEKPLFNVHYTGLRKDKWTPEYHDEVIQRKYNRLKEMDINEDIYRMESPKVNSLF